MSQICVAYGALMLMLSSGCAFGCDYEPSASRSTAAAEGGQPDIDHLAPPRDFVGPRPSRFAWTAIPGAETYTMGIWNEADTRVFYRAGIAATELALPDEVVLDAGTYFWSVRAERGGTPIAESGFSAFVVKS